MKFVAGSDRIDDFPGSNGLIGLANPTGDVKIVHTPDAEQCAPAGYDRHGMKEQVWAIVVGCKLIANLVLYPANY